MLSRTLRSAPRTCAALSSSSAPRARKGTSWSSAAPQLAPRHDGRASSPPTMTVTTTTTRLLSTSPPRQACKPKPSPSGRFAFKGPETIPGTSIRVLRTVQQLRAWRRPLAENRRTVALVPTMGALHDGHVSLIRQAVRESHEVVVSIYVNPAQFGIAEDLASYPVTWAADVAALTALDRDLADDGAALGRVAAVFAPTTAEMYPEGFPGQEVASPGSFVSITPLGALLEGTTRPTFFRGVATVCTKLFNAVQPNRVYFGQKDVQQTVVIRRLVRDFMMPIEVIIGPTVREADGLALSSRNVYLGTRRRAVATVLNRALKAAEAAHAAGSLDRGEILGAANAMASTVLREQQSLAASQRVLFEVDYIALSDPDTMEEVDAVDPAKGAILSGAIKMLPVEDPQPGEDLGHSNGPAVRLIDNIILPPREV